MKKIIAVLIILLLALGGGLAYILLKAAPPEFLSSAGIIKHDNKEGKFDVYQNSNFLRSFSKKDEAIEFATQYTRTHIEQEGSKRWVWDNYPQFSVLFENEEYLFNTFQEAMSYAKEHGGSLVLNRANKARIWDTANRLPTAHMIENVPLIAQNPELPRGCEVTSLAMMLNYYGIGVSKMDLAEQIKKDETPFKKDSKGNVSFGDPRNGFVGDMYDKSKPGLGVYQAPLFDLLKEYVGTDAINLTGGSFVDLFYFIARDKPVMVITNATFELLPNEKFETWNTPNGPIDVTMSEHAVLIKGYDQQYIYFNNPLDDSGVQKAPIEGFVLAWEQMGKQALTYFE